MTYGVVLSCIGVVGALVGQGSAVFLLAFLMIPGVVLVLLAWTMLPRILSIDRNLIHLRGVCDAFMKQLPKKS
jgi:hypothetical protein